MPSQQQSQHTAGLTLVFISALVFSTCGLFVKGINSEAWAIIFWRGIFASAFTIGYILLRGTWQPEWRQMGRSGIAVAIVGACGTAAFIPAYKYTTVTNVSLIYATAPLISALIAWRWYRERTSTLIIIASLCALLGVALVMYGSTGSAGSIHFKGDLLAIWMTIMMALGMCIYRRYPSTPAAGPAILACLLLLPPAILFGNPFIVPLKEIALSALFGLVFATAAVTVAEGARRLPASETALLSALETPIAIILAIVILQEIPNALIILGGLIVMLAVVLPQTKSLRRIAKG